MDPNNLKSAVESVLFASGEPIKVSKLAKILNVDKPEMENALMQLGAEYVGKSAGITLVKSGDEVQLATNPANAEFVSQMMKSELQEDLSQAALEVLSIIAYRSPVTRSDIELIRGVNCSYTLRNLLLRGLIERKDNPKDNRGYIYVVSFEFLKKLGLESIEKLPDYETLSKDDRIDSIVKTAEEQQSQEAEIKPTELVNQS
ncbi:SMC-Scp complex subunit ScpB [Patescibacteria group bacterium]|nr:MAG: SMC-Scp complex subunit ScpB [Patescibacteria group bacterium]